jgi:hypothetical protein
MIAQCNDCQMYFEDCYRSTICPHETFAANDGSNNFAHHPESYLSQIDPYKAETVTKSMSGPGGAIAGFTGLRIEDHHVLPGRQVCVLYYQDRRMAVIYPDLPIAEIRVIHEPDIRVRVMKRGQGLAFEE